MIVGMSQGQDGLDLVIAGDSPHRPAFLPASAVELAVFHDHELARQDIVVAVPPELLGAENHQADRQSPANPGASNESSRRSPSTSRARAIRPRWAVGSELPARPGKGGES